jgi:hypothetical protein
MQTLTVNVLVHSKLSLPVGLLLSVWLKGERSRHWFQYRFLRISQRSLRRSHSDEQSPL